MREPFINIAIEAARAAGNLITRAIKRLDTIKIAEKRPNDYVTETDQRVEQEIVNIILKAYPTHGIIGEEGGERKGKEQDYLWIIDPIDGTRNFIHGFPHFAISIALMYKNRLEHGVIYDPIRQELFTASRGKGARLNDKRIRVSPRKHLQECLLGAGLAYHRLDKEKTINMLAAIQPYCSDIRRAGAATLDLAYVACGRLDGYLELGLHSWDIAAGILLVKEAGGLVCDTTGGEDYFKTGNIVAANPKILRQLLKIVKPCCEHL